MGFAIFGAYPICFAAARDALFELKPAWAKARGKFTQAMHAGLTLSLPYPNPIPTLSLPYHLTLSLPYHAGHAPAHHGGGPRHLEHIEPYPYPYP